MSPLQSVGPHDAAALFALHAPLFDPPWSEESLAWQLSQPGSAALAVRSEAAAMAGFVLLRTVVDEAEILIIAVDPARQRRGIGRVLLDGACALAQAQGAATLWLEVAVDNAAALALYAGAGFEPAGRRPRYYSRAGGAAVDALLLRRALAG